jgi:hypothetical protein
MTAPLPLTEAERVRIAEFDGWTYTYGSASDEGFPWLSPRGAHKRELPDYANDLNACAGFEKRLTEEQWDAYLTILITKIVYLGKGSHRALLHASAPERCRAILNTLDQTK